MGLRERLNKVKKLAVKAGVGAADLWPMVVVCKPRFGEETRAGGVYWEETAPGNWWPEIVFEGEGEEGRAEVQHLLAVARKELDAGVEWKPMIIVSDPRPVRPRAAAGAQP